jgi:predicted HicB family RNase H-like nuclease
MNAKRYTYRVIWSEEDSEFVALCAEFPSLSWLDTEQSEALAGMVSLVEQTVADMEASGESVPEPLSLQKFSGKFMVRTTPEVHRRLAVQAMESGVSMNRLVNSKLQEHSV